jgi:DNA-binding NtrC family response regulator
MQLKIIKLNKLGIQRDYPQLVDVIPLHEIEKRYIIRAYVTCNFNKVHTAKKLEVSLKGLRNKLKRILKEYEY